MKKIVSLTGIIFFFLLALSPLAFKKRDKEKMNEAIEKSLVLLQKSSHTFLENANGCHSCHHQGLGGVSFALAKEKGYPIQDSIVQELEDSIEHTWRGNKYDLTESNDGSTVVMTGGYGMWALAANHVKPDKYMIQLANNIMQKQSDNGSWVSPNPRPPLEYYAFSATALSVKGIQYFLPAALQPIVKERLEHAKKWMMQTTPQTNEERIYQILGLSWCNGDPGFIKKQAAGLLAKQQADGGWSQLESLPTDAYATGQSLYALNESGYLNTEDSSYKKGIAYLLNTQREDGSWKVQSRSYAVVPYVYSGFPHGENQFISAAGSNWATMALLLAVK